MARAFRTTALLPPPTGGRSPSSSASRRGSLRQAGCLGCLVLVAFLLINVWWHLYTAPPSVAMDARPNLIAWARREGIWFPSVAVHWFQYPNMAEPVRGLISTRKIERGEDIVVVPRQWVLTAERVAETRFYREMLSVASPIQDLADRDNDTDIELAIVAAYLTYVWQEKTNEDGFYPLVVSWEDTPTSAMGLFVEPDHPNRVLVARAERLAKRCHLAYKRTIRHLKLSPATATMFNRPAYSYDNFKRIFALVKSRYWELGMVQGKDSDGKPQPDLPPHVIVAPIAELFNFGYMGVLAERNRTHFRLYASKDIAAGVEVLFYYGSVCREHFQTNYGFHTDEHKPCKPKPTPAGKLVSRKALVAAR